MKISLLNNRKKLSNLLLASFFMVSLIEIFAECNENKLLIWITKPLILPFLVGYYLSMTKKRNNYFLAAIFCSWIANLLFIEDTLEWIIYASVFFLIYKILIIYIVLSKVKMPSLLPLIIGSMPFVFIYATVCLLSFEAMGDNLYLFLLHGIFTIFLGGLSLGNYIMDLNKSNFVLFLSTMLFALTQFIFVLIVFYNPVYLFHALAMVLFVIGQFLLTKFIFLIENSESNYEVITDLGENT